MHVAGGDGGAGVAGGAGGDGVEGVEGVEGVDGVDGVVGGVDGVVGVVVGIVVGKGVGCVDGVVGWSLGIGGHIVRKDQPAGSGPNGPLCGVTCPIEVALRAKDGNRLCTCCSCYRGLGSNSEGPGRRRAH